MKKYLYLLMAAAAIVTVSCKKDDDKKGEEPTGPSYRIKTLSYSEDDRSWSDTWTFSYDEQGRVAEVDRGEESKHWMFTYSDKKVTVVRKSDNATVYVLTLNDAGFCTTMVDEWNETRTYKYDASGRVTEIAKEGEVKSVITLRDNCIVSWTKDGGEKTKEHKYGTVKNIGDVHTIYSEATDPARWMYETGLFGHASEYVCTWNKWDYSDDGSTITYKYDDNGYIISESKVFDSGWAEFYDITWEEVK